MTDPLSAEYKIKLYIFITSEDTFFNLGCKSFASISSVVDLQE